MLGVHKHRNKNAAAAQRIIRGSGVVSMTAPSPRMLDDMWAGGRTGVPDIYHEEINTGDPNGYYWSFSFAAVLKIIAVRTSPGLPSPFTPESAPGGLSAAAWSSNTRTCRRPSPEGVQSAEASGAQWSATR